MSDAARFKDPQTGQDIVLVLQGGGALGAYQAGVYQALCTAKLQPGWIAGISIGAINAAIIAGNPPDKRVDRLRAFWTQVTASVPWRPLFRGDDERPLFTALSAAWVVGFGVPGFFTPRIPPPGMLPATVPEALSFYDTRPLRQTLERLVDFERINAKEMRLSVGAVNVETGNFAYFDNMRQKIGPEHIMASGALPPGFPPVEIDGCYYWDGGLVSNTPLQYVLDNERKRDLLIFQVDLFAARGELPATLSAAGEREKDIRYSSRTRLNTDMSLREHQMKIALRQILDKLPPDLRALPECREVEAFAKENSISVVHFINRRRKFYSNSKDYEFSRTTMHEHWANGIADVRIAVSHRDWIRRRLPKSGVAVFDFAMNQVRYTNAEGLQELSGQDEEKRERINAIQATQR